MKINDKITSHAIVLNCTCWLYENIYVNIGNSSSSFIHIGAVENDNIRKIWSSA